MAPHYRNSAPSALDWVLEHFSVTPVLNGGEKRSGQFLGLSSSVLGSEWTLAQGLVDVLLPNDQSWSSLCHLFQLSSVLFPFSPNPWQQRRLLSSELGQASGLCPPYVFSDLGGSLQSRVLRADITLLAPLDLLSLPVASVVLPYRIDLPWQPHFHLLHQDFCVLCLFTWRPFSDLLDVLAGLGAWLVRSLCVVTAPPVPFASAGRIVLGIVALVRVIQC